ncbi:MAG: hypothetical protein JSS00_13215 [Proteobacteria bacterium]|nr:hypothetical protein [Pseudomonadota bacterium]
MQHLVNALRALPADIADQAQEPAVLEQLSDATLVRATARAIERPKVERSTSFTLHAPMELLARAALLPLVQPPLRPRARLRIAAIAAQYAEGEEIAARNPSFPTAEAAEHSLLIALRDGDADTADDAISFLAPKRSAQELRALLADAVIPSLAAAAHAPILLNALPGACAQFGGLSSLLRAPVRALALDAALKLTWVNGDQDDDGPDALFDALAAPAPVASPHVFIAPTMLAVEACGHAAQILSRATAAVPLEDAARELMRIAALSMLQDDPAHAPYGWTHCLTMPQAVLGLATVSRDPRTCLRVAATYVLGFRATLGRTPLATGWTYPTPISGVAALAWSAATHRDAHLAKYTWACLNAAAEDPEARLLYLAAASNLADWWEANPNAGFDL